MFKTFAWLLSWITSCSKLIDSLLSVPVCLPIRNKKEAASIFNKAKNPISDQVPLTRIWFEASFDGTFPKIQMIQEIINAGKIRRQHNKIQDKIELG